MLRPYPRHRLARRCVPLYMGFVGSHGLSHCARRPAPPLPLAWNGDFGPWLEGLVPPPGPPTPPIGLSSFQFLPALPLPEQASAVLSLGPASTRFGMIRFWSPLPPCFPYPRTCRHTPSYPGRSFLPLLPSQSYRSLVAMPFQQARISLCGQSISLAAATKMADSPYRSLWFSSRQRSLEEGVVSGDLGCM